MARSVSLAALLLLFTSLCIGCCAFPSRRHLLQDGASSTVVGLAPLGGGKTGSVEVIQMPGTTERNKFVKKVSDYLDTLQEVQTLIESYLLQSGGTLADVVRERKGAFPPPPEASPPPPYPPPTSGIMSKINTGKFFNNALDMKGGVTDIEIVRNVGPFAAPKP